MGAYGHAFVLELVTEVEGKIVVGKDELGDLDKEFSGR